jgi:hypothetical protein
MNHRAFTIFVLVFSCIAAIGFINAKAADEQLETPISRGLPKGKVELLKLSIGELGLAVRRLEESSRIDIPKLCSCPRPEPTGAEETKRIKDQTQAIRTHLNKAEDTARRMAELQKSLRDNAAELRRHKKCIKAFGGFAAWQNKINEMIQREDDGRGDSILKTKLRKEIAKEEKAIDKKKKDAAKKREKCRKDLTQATGRMADTKRKIREEKEALGKMLRTYRKKYGHSLSLGQHALALHLYPSYDSIVNTLGVTTLRSALQSATSRGDMKEVKRLLKMGADVHQKAGEYSALALANILGHADIVEILAPSYADVQTPWDTHKRQGTQNLLHMVDNQLKRVSDLFSIVKASDKGAKDLNYCEKWLNHLKCKVSCIKKHSTGSTAQTR